MSRALNDLDSRLLPKVFELIARAAEHGIPVLIVDVLRTDAQQRVNVARGASATQQSKHLPQPPDGKSLAIDLCPYEHFELHGPDKLSWDSADPSWAVLGAIGEGLGLRWGGRWKDPHDPGHFEWVKPTT